MAAENRLVKRQKLSNGSSHRAGSTRSRIFAPYRTIGLVSSTSVPFTSIAIGKTTFQITTSVGHSLQTYDIRKGLHLNFITRPQTPQLITASVAFKDKVLAAWGGSAADSSRGVWVFKRGKQEAELELPRGFKENVESLLILGAWIVGVCSTKILIWSSASYEPHTILEGLSPVPFTTCIAQLPTFINKIIVGRQDGTCEIWNVSSGKLLYTTLPPSTEVGAITALEPTPALSLVAIAYESGLVVIHDIRLDQTVLSFDAGVAATSISFRTDGLGAGDDGQKAGMMVTASTSSGDVTVWDLNNGGRRSGVLRAAHAQPSETSGGGVSRAGFLPGQGILVTSGLDNSLKTWIFDESPFKPVPRILHQRGGHGAPVTTLSFLPTASDGSEDIGKWLVSGSNDQSLWGWSLRRDAQSAELSQGAVQSKARKQGLLAATYQDAYRDLKCPPARKIACSLNRDGGIGALPGKQPIWQSSKGKRTDAETSAMTGWESVLTAHEGDNKARTWFWGRRRAGRWAFLTSDGGNVSSVSMSPCGTFAVVGSEKGSIDMFNMQSGQHRQHLPAKLTPMQARQLRLDASKHKLKEETDGQKTFYRGQGRHTSAVVGLGVDEMNKFIVSADADGKVKFWDFRSGLLIHEVDWSLHAAQILGMSLHRAANLASFTCSDHCVRVVDITTHRLVRELRVPAAVSSVLSGHLLGSVISQDARWLISAIGQLVMVWDLPTGHLIDALKLRSQCTSLSISPTGEFLATASEGNVGIEIWSNRSLFTYTANKHIEDETLLAIIAADAMTPTPGGEIGHSDLTEQEVEEMDDDASLEDDMLGLAEGMVSLSVVPKSRWQNLLHLDLIRQRNKPIEPPKKPQKAPFFLPSIQSSTLSQTEQSASGADIALEKSRVQKRLANQAGSKFTTLLQNAAESNTFAEFLDHLKGLGPAEADIEIRSLSALDNELTTFVRALTWLAGQHKDYELVQAWMAVFLRIHGDIARNDVDLRDAIRDWSAESARESQRVQRIADYCGGLVGYLRAARV